MQNSLFDRPVATGSVQIFGTDGKLLHVGPANGVRQSPALPSHRLPLSLRTGSFRAQAIIDQPPIPLVKPSKPQTIGADASRTLYFDAKALRFAKKNFRVEVNAGRALSELRLRVARY